MSKIDWLTKRLNTGHKIDLDEMGISPLTFLGRGIVVVLLPKRSLLTAKMNNGTLIRGRNRAGFGGRGVFMFREAVEPELALLDLILGPDDNFVDVGSCVGSYTITAANSLRGGGGVIAIDPNPDSMAILKETVAMNSLHNVMLVCAAVSDAVGFTQFSIEAERPDTRHIEETGSTIAADLHRVVPTTTVDHIAREVDLSGRIRMMKIDAEGAEDLVLKGSAKTIAKFQPVLILETVIADIPALPGYIPHKTTDSRNTVLVHEGDTEALEKLKNETAFTPLA
jgi:FkbM family methyltransferase